MNITVKNKWNIFIKQIFPCFACDLMSLVDLDPEYSLPAASYAGSFPHY